MSAVGAKESFAATRLIALSLETTASRPWLRSSAATRLNKDAAAPRYLCKFTKTNFGQVCVIDRACSGAAIPRKRRRLRSRCGLCLSAFAQLQNDASHQITASACHFPPALSHFLLSTCQYPSSTCQLPVSTYRLPAATYR